ncbi:hypothetical protein BDN72DRAFT_860906 [Pluteus cervinus]|uniref:Uncharacterized protein n=1 Tax=Pluteus cervinus TaxID=181527 RepID=A0ACD3AH96_9AGAR|nr:hypothetical protein BDN72DRAFT_860906 [Pluteus cervinus]
MVNQPMRLTLNATLDDVPPEGVVLELRVRPNTTNTAPVAAAGAVNATATNPVNQGNIAMTSVTFPPPTASVPAAATASVLSTTTASVPVARRTHHPPNTHPPGWSFSSRRPLTTLQGTPPPMYSRRPHSTTRPVSPSIYSRPRPHSTTRSVSPSSEIDTNIRGVGRRLRGGVIQHRGTTAVVPHIPRPLGDPIVISSDEDDSEIEEVVLLQRRQRHHLQPQRRRRASEEELWRQVPNLPESLMVEAAEATEALMAEAAAAEALLAEAEAAEAWLAETTAATEALVEGVDALTLTATISRGDDASTSTSPSDDDTQASSSTNLTSSTNPQVEEGGNDEVTPEDWIRQARALHLKHMNKRNPE